MDDEDELIILCKKCYDNENYFIPLFQKGKNEYEIELKCPKNHIIDEDNIIHIFLDEKLKNKLGKCKDHCEVFCGWSEDEFRNICFYDVGKLMKVKKDYLLYGNMIPSYVEQIKQKEHIKKIDELIIKYKNDTPELIKEIEYLKILQTHIRINLELFYNLKIHNYQIIKNINNVLNIITPEEVDDLDKKRLLNKYRAILYGINKIPKDLEIKEANLSVIDHNCFEPLIGINPYNNKKNYFLQFIRGKSNEITIYEPDGNFINKISLLPDFFDVKNYLELMFIEKVLIVFHRNCLNFFIISNDYKNYDSYNIYFEYLLGVNTFLSEINYKTDDLLKINATNILLINNKNGYVITFDKELKQILQLNKLNNNNIIKANTVYYINENNLVETGIIIISDISLIVDNTQITYESKFTMYNDKMEIIHEFNFKFDCKKNSIIKLHHNYTNHMLLIFTLNRIFQLKLDTQEIIAVYDIKDYINAEETNYQNLANKIKIIYNYDKASEKIEEKILLINDKTKQLCLFEWEEKMLVLKSKDIYPNLLNVIVFYPVDVLYLLNEKLIFEPEILFIDAIVDKNKENNNNDSDLYDYR